MDCKCRTLFRIATPHLRHVIPAYQAFHSGQGPQGILGKPSNQQLDTVFGSSKDVDVALIILEKGRHQVTEGVQGSTFGSTNATRGSAVLDSRGKGLSGV